LDRSALEEPEEVQDDRDANQASGDSNAEI